MRILRAALGVLGVLYDTLIPPKVYDSPRSRAQGLCGDGPEAVSAGPPTTAPASGHPNALTTLGLWQRNRLWLLSGGLVDSDDDRYFAYYGWYDDRWSWTTDGDRWHPSHAQRGDELPAPSGEHWVEVVGWPFAASGACPPAAEDDPGASSPFAPGSPAASWAEIPRGYHDDPDEFHWVRWVIPAITRVIANHVPKQLYPDGTVFCMRADGSPCEECGDWDSWVSHVSPNVAVGIHAAAAAES